METLIPVGLEIVIQAGSLWVAMKILRVDGTPVKMLGIAAVSSVHGFLPILGFVLGIAAMFYLIRQWTDADIWPDTIAMVVVAAIARLVLALLIADVYVDG